MKSIILTLMLFSCSSFASEQTGLASWYGSENKTLLKSNNKAPYAAHKTLKLGTKVLVTSIKTKKSVVVTIVDRGPYTHKRILDVNIFAAKQLGMVSRGITKVTLIPL